MSPPLHLSMIVITTMTLNQSGCNMCSAHRLSMVNICGELCQNPSGGSTVMERTKFVIDRQTDRQTDRQSEQKQYVSPLHGVRLTYQIELETLWQNEK